MGEYVSRAWKETWALAANKWVLGGAPVSVIVVGIANGVRSLIERGETISLGNFGTLVGISVATALLVLVVLAVVGFVVNLAFAPHKILLKTRVELQLTKSRIAALQTGKPTLRIIFRAGEQPYEYVSLKDTDNPQGGWEDWRYYCVGVKAVGTSVEDVQVRLDRFEGTTTDGRPVSDRRPGALTRLDSDDSEPVTVHPGADGIMYFEVARKDADPSAQIRIAYGRQVNFFGKSSFLPPGDYIFTIAVVGRDVTEAGGPKRFRVRVVVHPGFNDHGRLLFEPAPKEFE